MMKIFSTSVWLCALPALVSAQQAVTRSQAVESAVLRGGRLAIASADSSAASARLLAARSLQNPTFNAAYSRSAPELHFTLDLPIDLPNLRNARLESAQAAVRAAEYRYRFERAAAALDADTTFTRALAFAAHARLSRRTALVADTLLQMAIVRRDAGDASDLEVELARLNAGQQHNLATADSVELIGALIDLQSITGLRSDSSAIVVADSLYLPQATVDTLPVGTALPIASGLESVHSAEAGIRVERLGVFGSPSLVAGFETRDPGGTENQLLPTFGFSIPFPLFNRNRAGIAQARSDLLRARADLSVTTLEYAAVLHKMQRQRATAYARAERDRRLLSSADRVASMSVTAYRAGAVPLANVFEAQRAARDVLRQYVDDLADIWVADATLRVLTLTSAR